MGLFSNTWVGKFLLKQEMKLGVAKEMIDRYNYISTKNVYSER